MLLEFPQPLLRLLLLLRSVLELSNTHSSRCRGLATASLHPFGVAAGFVIKALPGSGMSWCVTCVMLHVLHAAARVLALLSLCVLVSKCLRGGVCFDLT